MADTLNPHLYRQLVRKFGLVRVVCPGEKMLARTDYDAWGEPRLQIDHPGEYYKVCCPYCRDTRYRLYVNHMFCQLDGHNRRMKYVAVCYNENCLDRSDNLRTLIEDLDEINLFGARVMEGRVVPEDAREVAEPGTCIPLSSLKPADPARVYLTSRGFDPDALGELFQVTLCVESRYTLAQNRLIIPVIDRGKLKGWQARYIGELDWKGPRRHELPPKYFSCPGSNFRSKCILNFERMKEWATGVIVEGPTDVFRFGSMAGCIFGNTMTETQRRRFTAVFRLRTGVLVLDPEECESASTKKLLDYFLGVMPGRFCAVRLPPGTDPGSLDRTVLKEYVRAAAAAQGVTVTYRKVESK